MKIAPILIIIFCSSCSIKNSTIDFSKNSMSYNSYLLNLQWDSKVDLKGGLSGSNLSKVSKNQQHYVIRDIHQRNSEDKIREIHAQIIASEEEYGPKIYAYDIPNGKILMSFLESIDDDLTPHEQTYHLAKLLLKIHMGSPYRDHVSILNQTKKLICEKVKVLPKGIIKTKIVEELSKDKELSSHLKRSTHRDLNFNNMFFTKKGYRIIDFENAGQDDPFYDIATIIIFNFYNSPFEKDFLFKYFGRQLKESELERLKQNKKLVFLHYALGILKKLQKFNMDNVATVEYAEVIEDFKLSKRTTTETRDLLILANSMFIEAEKYYTHH